MCTVFLITMNDDLFSGPHHHFWCRALSSDNRHHIWLGVAMFLDPHGLQSAAEALSERLRSEANEQNADVVSFPDGRVSLELEWIDVQSIAHHVIAAYLQQVRDTGTAT
jgi:hypothetical protein